MKKLMALLAGMAALVVLFASLAFGEWWDFSGCHAHVTSESTSPNGEWEVARRSETCDHGEPPFQFALRRSAESFDQNQVFAEVHQDADPLFKWNGNHHVTLAARKNTRFMSIRLQNLSGIDIQLDTYPDDPAIPRDTSSHRVIRRPITVSMTAKEGSPYGKSHFGCNLEIEGVDEDYVGHLYLKFFTLKTFAHDDTQYGKIIRIPEKISASRVIRINGKSSAFLTGVTSAAIGDHAPLMMSSHNRGLNGPRDWDIGHNIRMQDLEENVAHLKSGDLKARVSYWLENTEVIYDVQRPAELGPIDDFRLCLVRMNNLHKVEP